MTTSEQNQKGKFLIVDGNGLAYRAFYSGLMYRSAQGLPVNAICGFVKLLFNVIYSEAPSYVCVAFDHSALTEHLLNYQGYNVQREQQPDELAVQLPIIEDFVHACGIKTCRMPGFEADDCIGTMVQRAQEAGLRSLIVAGDLSLLQLIAPNVRVLTMRRGLNDTVVYNEDLVMSEFRLPPSLLASLRALSGDSGQNIPGIPGIGNVTAGRLLSQYHSLDALFENLDRLPAKWRNPLSENLQLTQEYLQKATIRTDLPLPLQIEDCRFHGIPIAMFSRIFSLLGTGFEFGPNLLARLHNMAIPEEPSALPDEALEGEEARAALRRCVASSGSLSVVWLITCERERGLAVACAGQPIVCLLCEGGVNQLTSQEVWEILKPAFADAQRIKYVYGYQNLAVPYHVQGENVLDVSLASGLLHPEMWNHDFETISSRFGLVAYASQLLFGDGTLDWELIPVQNKVKWLGCAAKVMSELGPKVEAALHEAGLWDMYWDVDVPLAASQRSLLRRGMNFDVEAGQGLRDLIEAQRVILRNDIYREAGYSFDIDDDRALGELLFAKLNLLVPTRPKPGEPIGTNILVALEGQHPLVTEIRKYRELGDFISVFVDEFIGEGKIDFDVNGSLFNLALVAERSLHMLNKVAVYGASLITHRLEAVMGNILSVDMRVRLHQEARQALVARSEDECIIALNFPLISLRMLAHLAGDSCLQDALQKGTLLEGLASALSHHTAEALAVVRLGNAVLLTCVCMGPRWLARRLLVSEEEAEQMYAETMDYFRSHFPVSMQFVASQIAVAENWGKLTTLSGRRYSVVEAQSRLGRIRTCARRRAAAFAIEGSVADFQRLLVSRVFRKYGTEVDIFPVFDFDLINVRKDKVQDVVATVADICRNNGLGVDIPFEWSTGANMREAFEALRSGL